MRQSKNILTDKEMELVSLLMKDCESTGDIQKKLKRLFAGTIEQMLESEMDEHLGYEKHSNEGDHSGNSRNGYEPKTIYSEYGASEINVPRDRNGEFEPKLIKKYFFVVIWHSLFAESNDAICPFVFPGAVNATL